MKKLPLLEAVLSTSILLGVSTLLYLYTSGYRLVRDKKKPLEVRKMGMISAKSIPEGASVYLNGNLVTATNDTIAGLDPKQHTLRISKKGYVEWSKDIEVYPELVTDITAVLVSESPRIEPLTNTGAKNPVISPSLSKLAFFSDDSEKPGLWITQLSSTGLNIFRNGATAAIEDTKLVKYSDLNRITWSPDEKEILIEKVSEVTTPPAPQPQVEIAYLIDLNDNTAQSVYNPEKIRLDWHEVLRKKRADFLEKIDIPEQVRTLAMAEQTVWSPDEKKFLYTTQIDDTLEYRVYNMDNPLPVGEKTETVVFTKKTSEPQPIISWYSDSYHLILLDGNVMADKKGTVSLIRIDGTNKTEIFNNTLLADKVFSAPGGDKVIVLTSFKSSGRPDLYTISIR